MNAVCTDSVEVFVVAPAMLCWGLERLVQSALPRIELTGTASSLAEAQERLTRCSAHVVVLDLDGGYDLEALTEFNAGRQCKLLVLTSSHDNELLDRAVVAGVRGVVRKSDPPQALLKAIEKVNDGELWIDRSAAGRIFMEMSRQNAARANDPDQQKIALLTSRERQTIIAVASDTAAPGKVIASRLCISEHTLRNHLSSIYGKLGLQSRLDLYAYATKHRLHR
jgi:DNA-binding NarL/FixJ family response regulator